MRSGQSSDSDSLELLTPLMTKIFDVTIGHKRRVYDSDSVASETSL